MPSEASSKTVDGIGVMTDSEKRSFERMYRALMRIRPRDRSKYLKAVWCLADPSQKELDEDQDQE